MRRAAKVKVTAEQRAELLKLMRAGNNLESACSAVDLSVDTVTGDIDLHVACGRAFAVGTGRLAAALLEKALNEGDTHILERQLVGREQKQLRFPTERPAESGADGGFGERLAQLSDDELTLVTWAMGEGFERPAVLMTAGDHLHRLRLEEAAARAAAERLRPKAPRLEDIRVDDPSQPIPRARALRPIPPAEDAAGFRHLAATDPGAAAAWAMFGPRPPAERTP